MKSDLSNFFEDYEFECKCGKCGLGIAEMKKSFLLRLATAREIADCSFVLTSAMRCLERNEEEGGSKTSSHLKGFAVDIKAKTSNKRYRIVRALLQAGFERIGIHKSFIHVDTDPAKPKGLVWLY